ncbi:MAG: hypothetical protein ABIN57_07510 [Chitinophagaceae bacterium]
MPYKNFIKNKQKTKIMKKFLAVAAIVAVTFTACNDTKTSDESTTKDTTTIVTPVAPDTTKVVTTTTTDTMHVEGTDTTKHN